MWAEKMRFKQHFEHSYVKTFGSIFKQQYMFRNVFVPIHFYQMVVCYSLIQFVW